MSRGGRRAADANAMIAVRTQAPRRRVEGPGVSLAHPPTADSVTDVRDRPPGLESFDPTGLLELADLAGVREFTDMFSAQISLRLPELADALAREDAAEVYQIAHGLKGSAATVGTPQVMRLCEAICQMAKTGSCVGVSELHTELVDAWNDAARVIAAYLDVTKR
jgi:HPt (histidine-containing phosphotransfer) domain-containing protein